MSSEFDLDVVMPVHNEAENLDRVLQEFQREFDRIGIKARFILSEDGSTDNTKDVIRELSKKYSLLPLLGEVRKGYSKAVIDGLQLAQSPWVLCVDSDGQYDPLAMESFWKDKEENCLLVGRRLSRGDSWLRKTMSGSFRVFFFLLFPMPVKDPSCAFLLFPKNLIPRILKGKIGRLRQGFWWEFLARTNSAKITIKSIPVVHRPRFKGETQIYHLSKIPVIAAGHLWELWKLRLELAKQSK